MNLGQITKPDKENKTTSKKKTEDVILVNCDVNAIFAIYSQFGAIWKPDPRGLVCKTYILINSNFLSYKNWKKN